jgi:nitrate/TMAO reductase-like tetraheme cytochrome c subunit
VYARTTNPNHAAAGFPTTCATCHTTTQWTGATFNHTAFPITTGAHKKGTWNSCTDCHPNATNYTVFSCTTGCHPASKTNGDHSGVRNYVYNSANCYSCHPQGRH